MISIGRYLRENKSSMTVYNKNNKNNKIIVGQWKISDNIHTQVYLAIIQIRTILITHSSDIDCIMEIRNKQAPCCIGN